MRHAAAMSRPAGDDSNAGKLSRSRSMSVSLETCGSEKSQVPPASQAYPSRHCVIWSADVGRFTSAMVLRFILRSIESYSGGKPDRLCNPTEESGQPQGSRNVRERFATGPGRDWSSFARRSSCGEQSVEIVQ